MIIKCPWCHKDIETEDVERIEGMKAIRKYIDPLMTEKAFYKYHRKAIEHLLIRRMSVRIPTGGRKPSYFTFKRLLLGYMIERAEV